MLSSFSRPFNEIVFDFAVLVSGRVFAIVKYKVLAIIVVARVLLPPARLFSGSVRHFSDDYKSQHRGVVLFFLFDERRLFRLVDFDSPVGFFSVVSFGTGKKRMTVYCG